jgi:hypothetical protein
MNLSYPLSRTDHISPTDLRSLKRSIRSSMKWESDHATVNAAFLEDQTIRWITRDQCEYISVWEANHRLDNWRDDRQLSTNDEIEYTVYEGRAETFLDQWAVTWIDERIKIGRRRSLDVGEANDRLLRLKERNLRS